jgi:predicted secreted Zn-dependent protease
LRADPVARRAFDRLAYGLKLQHVRAIESAKKPETRTRRIEKAVATLRARESAGGDAARAKSRGARSPKGTGRRPAPGRR